MAVSLTHAGSEHAARVVIDVAAGRSASVDGARLASTEPLRRAFPTLVFTPDRLSVIKGGPAVRRAYFDRCVSRLFPARAALAGDYAAAVGQRNAALRRVRLGLSPRSTLEPWTRQVVDLAAPLVASRRAAVSAISAGFSDRLAEFGVAAATLCYPSDAPSLETLERRLDADIANGTTGSGPHRDDVVIEAGGHDLRSFGSQGQQRLALLALLLAEAELVPDSPLLLLDDVLSELDAGRRRLLAERVGRLEQTLLTTTHAASLPCAPDQIVEVSPGHAR